MGAANAARREPAPAGRGLPGAEGGEGRRLLSIAHGHHVWDERVLRALEAAERFPRRVLAVDRALAAGVDPGEVERVRGRLGGGVEVVLLPSWPRVRGLARLTRGVYADRIARQAAALAPHVVHVHESGILGLMVAARVRRRLPGARIVFDYHDWIPDEIAQSVRHAPGPYRLATRLWMPRLRRMARAVDVAVCVSPGHAAWTRDVLGIRRTVVVQNVRSARQPPRLGRDGFRPELVWVGHVMRIRRLELMVDVLARLRAQGVDATVSIFGEVAEPGYADELRARARAAGVEPWLAFHGRYRSDAELAARLGPGAVGVHPAHDERIPTGINRITSGNKFFSYLALGLPVLLDASFENMLQVAAQGGAGVAFSGVESCAAAARAIWDTPGAWERMSGGARAVAREWSSEAASAVLAGLFAELEAGGGESHTALVKPER